MIRISRWRSHIYFWTSSISLSLSLSYRNLIEDHFEILTEYLEEYGRMQENYSGQISCEGARTCRNGSISCIPLLRMDFRAPLHVIHNPLLFPVYKYWLLSNPPGPRLNRPVDHATQYRGQPICSPICLGSPIRAVMAKM